MDIKELSGSLSTVYQTAKSNLTTQKAYADKSVQVSETSNKQALRIDGSRLTIAAGKGSYDTLDLSSISKRLAREIALFKGSENKVKPTTEDTISKTPEISDEFIRTLIEAGKTVEKPNEEYDELAWGMLVTLGQQVGITDPDALMAVTASDLAMYFDERYHKTDEMFELLGNLDQNGNEVKRYQPPEDIWKDIFLMDENGEFIRGNGGVVTRNKEFERTQSTVGYLSYFGGVGVDNKISNMGPGEMLQFSLSIETGDSFWFREPLLFGGGAEPVYYHTHGLAEMKEEDRWYEYKWNLANVYDRMKTHSSKFPSPEAQRDDMVGAASRSDASWVTYKPFQSKYGFLDYV